MKISATTQTTSTGRPAKVVCRVAAQRMLCATIVVFLAAFVGQLAIAQTPGQIDVINREYPIKAAFLYHFSSYVQWPAAAFSSDVSPFVIGVYQEDPFGTALQTIAQTKNVAGRPIVVRRVSSRADVTSCHILFLPASVSPHEQDAVIRITQNASVLIVGESENFADHGGDVQFFVEGNKVRFAINAELTKGGELKVSSKLLSLAKIVTSE